MSVYNKLAQNKRPQFPVEAQTYYRSDHSQFSYIHDYEQNTHFLDLNLKSSKLRPQFYNQQHAGITSLSCCQLQDQNLIPDQKDIIVLLGVLPLTSMGFESQTLMVTPFWPPYIGGSFTKGRWSHAGGSSAALTPVCFNESSYDQGWLQKSYFV